LLKGLLNKISALIELLKKTWERKPGLVITSGLALIIGGIIASVAAVELTSTPEFCSSCHEMKPAYDSWKNSKHYNVPAGKKRADCRDCHVPPWDMPLAVFYSKTYHGIKDVYRHFAEKHELMDPGYHEKMKIHAPKGMYKESCLACHRDIYKKEYEGVVNVHAHAKKANCASCHTGLVHYPYPLVTKTPQTAH